MFFVHRPVYIRLPMNRSTSQKPRFFRPYFVDNSGQEIPAHIPQPSHELPTFRQWKTYSFIKAVNNFLHTLRSVSETCHRWLEDSDEASSNGSDEDFLPPASPPIQTPVLGPGSPEPYVPDLLLSSPSRRFSHLRLSVHSLSVSSDRRHHDRSGQHEGYQFDDPRLPEA